MPNRSPSAGFVLLRIFDSEIKVLCLHGLDGNLDFPKGHCDPQDFNMFHTAQRECFEESAILVSKNDLLTLDTILLDQLTLFCALTNQDAEIRKNPESGKYEHIAYEWCDPDIVEFILPEYLQSSIPWALTVVESYLTTGDKEP